MALFFFLLLLVDDLQKITASPCTEAHGYFGVNCFSSFWPTDQPKSEREVVGFSTLITCVGFLHLLCVGSAPTFQPRTPGWAQFGGEQTSYLLLCRLCSRVTFTPLSVVISIAYIHLLTVTVHQVLTICSESQP